MTVAIDPRTGRVIGQVTEPREISGPFCEGSERGSRRVMPLNKPLTLLTANGYVTVPRASVRLEEV